MKESQFPKKQYDRMMRDNIKEMVIASAEILFGLTVTSYQVVDTIEMMAKKRETDFLCIITDELNQRWLLHVEFQTKDDPDMVFRMLNYKALFTEKHRLPMLQFVVYLGQKQSSMATSLQQVISHEKLDYTFSLVQLMDVDHEKLVNSDIPEVILLAALANFNNKPAEQVLAQVVKSLKRCSKSPMLLEKYLRQLNELSSLRTFDQEANKIIQNMPIYFDKTKTLFYLAGVEDANKAREEELQLKDEQVVINMLNRGYDSQEITLIANVSEAFIQQVKTKNKL